MRIILFILLLSHALVNPLQAQESAQHKNLTNFCKVWGFLKYHHPTVAKGKINWDDEFLKRVKDIRNIDAKETISNYYTDWIATLGKIKECKKCENNFDKDKYFLKNHNLSWIQDTTSFTSDLIKTFKHIRDNRNQGKNFYAHRDKPYKTLDFSNELAYSDSIYPSAELRLLTLSRYWNIINYYYPYKYKIDEDWDIVLTDMIPQFLAAGDTITYHLTLRKLIAKIDDSHANLKNWSYLSEFIGTKNPSFSTKIFNDSIAIVTDIINDSLSKINNIQYGDIIYSINNKCISQRINTLAPYFSFSNQASKERDVARSLFSSNSDSILLEYKRDGIKYEQYVRTYPFSFLKLKGKFIKKDDLSTQILPHNIGYINMGTLQKENVKNVMKKMMETQAIIFDVRNYPHGTILKIIPYLYPKPMQLMTSIFPMASAPGVFYKKSLMAFGKRNKGYYKGKVFILINEKTQSHAETTAFLLRSAPNALLIGSQTAGADGRVVKFKLPGNIETTMTGEGIIIPDIQRNGLMPDIEVQPTIEGIRNHKDEVLEKAIELAK